jgi:glucose-6-phosphate 1-dehydrogenase
VDVLLVLRAPPRALFYGAGQGLPPPNRIRLRLQPDAGVTFALLAKRPGGGDVATEIPVSVDFRTALGAAEQPYERILADALAGDPPPLPTRRKRLARDLMAGNGGWHGPGPARP